MKKITVLSEPVKILRLLQQFGYKSAILAGGAVRDDYTGEEISDYDIFLWDPRQSGEFVDLLTSANSVGPFMDFGSENFEMERATEFVDLLQTFEVDQIFQHGLYGPLTKQDDGDFNNRPGTGAKLTSIWEAVIEYNTYQLIYTSISPVEHLNKYFDIGLCKAYCDGVKMRYTADFMKDFKNKTLTIVGQEMTPEQFKYALDYHVEKLGWKYPFYDLKIAPHNQNLFDQYLLLKP